MPVLWRAGSGIDMRLDTTCLHSQQTDWGIQRGECPPIRSKCPRPLPTTVIEAMEVARAPAQDREVFADQSAPTADQDERAYGRTGSQLLALVDREPNLTRRLLGAMVRRIEVLPVSAGGWWV